MSTPSYYNGNRRIGSALCLPPHLYNQSTWHETRGKVRPSASSHAAPWSQVNTRTRLVYDDASACEPPSWRANIYEQYDSAQPNCGPPISEDNLAMTDSSCCLSVPDTPTAPRCTSPLCAPLVSPPVAASPLAVARRLHATPAPDGNTICCGKCHAKFTGSYRRGNLARHVRLKHTKAKGGSYICKIEGCNKTFARQDARLKHARKHHPGLYSEPVQRGPGHRRYTNTLQSLRYDASTCHRQPNALPIRNKHGSEIGLVGALSSMEHTELSPTSAPDEVDWSHVASKAISTRQSLSTSDLHGGPTLADPISCVGQWLQPSSRRPDHERDGAGLSPEFCATMYHDDASDLELPHSARTVLCRLHAELGTTSYMAHMEGFITRWESIVQHMRNKKSEVYPLFAEGLQNIHASVKEVLENEPADPAIQSRKPYQHQPNNETHSSPSGNAALGLQANATTPLDWSLGHDAQLPVPDNGFHFGVDFANDERSNTAKVDDISCPPYKFYVMHGGTRPCFGCSASSVAQVRTHCRRTQHHGFPLFAQVCRRCSTDFIDEQSYNRHTSRHCERQTQLRGDVITLWVRLYLTFYPHAVKVPSPYNGDDSYLPDGVVTRCRTLCASLQPTTPASSRDFLDSRRQRRSTSRTTRPSTTPAAVDLVSNAALGIMVRDAFTSRHGDYTHMPPGSSPQHWDDALQYVGNLQGTLRHGPTRLTEPQLEYIVQQLEITTFAYRNLQQRQRLENQHRSPTQTFGGGGQSNTQYLHPASAALPHNNQSSPFTYCDYNGAADMSTQPSSQGFDTASSPYLHSTQTGPSSIHDPHDPIVFSPVASPYDYHRPSLPSEGSHYATSQRMQPAGVLFPGAYPQAETGFDATPSPVDIDPRFLELSHDEHLEPNVWSGRW